MHELMKLPYAHDSLEPYMDSQTVEIHHSKHHQGYVDKLNAALGKNPGLQEKSLEELLSNLDAIPEDIRQAVINTGGGVYNHNIFWETMISGGAPEPKGPLAEAINQKFGNFTSFKEKFSAAAGTLFGSGWGWLVINNGVLEIVATKNQDSPISKGQTPLLGIDVWEHAYYLKYQNRRPEFIENWWNIINWEKVEGYYTQEND